MSIKSKVSGVWESILPHVKAGGTWKPVRNVHTKVAGTWEVTYRHEYVYTFDAGVHTDVDLNLASLGLDKFNKVRIVIPADASLVASSTSLYALRTGTGYGSTLTIENNGVILGRGGNGGGGGSGYSYNEVHGPSGGTAGGPAIYIECDVTIDNNGTISGGGGGGSGGNGAVKVGTGYYAGGGGGGGRPYGAAGTSPRYTAGTYFYGSNGAAGTLTAAGAGGAGGSGAGGYAGAGGSGGAVGSSGGNSGQGGGSISFDSVNGYGGAAGTTYVNAGTFTVIQA